MLKTILKKMLKFKILQKSWSALFGSGKKGKTQSTGQTTGHSNTTATPDHGASKPNH